MSVIYLTAAELPRVLAAHEKTLPKAIQAGIRLAAERGRTHLMRQSPVDLGQYKNSWRVKETGAGPTIINDSPHAGIIELGARPHKVSREGIEALTAWVLRKLTTSSGKLKGKAKYGPTYKKPSKYGPSKPSVFGPSKGQSKASQAKAKAARIKNLADAQKAARGIAFAIAKKLEKEGQKGHFIVDKSMPQLSKFLAAEVARQVAKALNGKGI